MLTNKCSDQSVSSEVTLRSILLLRDICQGDLVTTDLVSITDSKSYEQARNVAFGLNVSEVDVFQNELKAELKQFGTASKITSEVSLVKDDTEMLLSKKSKVAGSEIKA